MTEAEGGLPSTIIERTRPWEVAVNFVFEGMLAPLISKQNVPWSLSVVAEPIGPGPEVILGTKAGTTVAGRLAYGPPDTTLSVPAGTLPVGTYRLLCAVTIPGYPIAGFYDIIIQIIE